MDDIVALMHQCCQTQRKSGEMDGVWTWPSNETAPQAPGVLECRPRSTISIDSIHLYSLYTFCWNEKIDAEHLHIEQFAWEFDLQLRAQWKASHVRVQASRNHVEYSQVDQDMSGYLVSLDVRQLPWPTEDLGPRLPTCWEPICECWRYKDTRTSYNKPYNFPKKRTCHDFLFLYLQLEFGDSKCSNCIKK